VEELESGGEERAGVLAVEGVELRRANAVLEENNMELALRLQDASRLLHLPPKVIVILIPIFSII
jgi:hypothetical protein